MDYTCFKFNSRLVCVVIFKLKKLKFHYNSVGLLLWICELTHVQELFSKLHQRIYLHVPRASKYKHWHCSLFNCRRYWLIWFHLLLLVLNLLIHLKISFLLVFYLQLHYISIMDKKKNFGYVVLKLCNVFIIMQGDYISHCMGLVFGFANIHSTKFKLL